VQSDPPAPSCVAGWYLGGLPQNGAAGCHERVAPHLSDGERT